ncbi:serpin family protein, partial [Leptolyngbya sp. FACHB-36]|uniref:serpin family protein n=1 Tax=Leptolyngbya sp. FACHB-36 TaxID=2692808 RepID=UPI0016818454
QNQDQTVFVSPSSVAIALAMTYNGASGNTQQAMAKALELQGMSLAEVNQANAALRSALENPGKNVQLSIANSLWARQGVEFKPDFLQNNQQFYSAEITDLDFGSPQAATQINDWVRQKTQGKIRQIVDQLKPDDVLFLVNAIYFKGDWTNEFDKRETTNKPFYRTNGTSKTLPLMSRTGDYRYYETEQFQAVSLPYGDRRMSLYVFLPKSKSTLAKFTKALTPENWQTWMQQFRMRSGTVQIPRFTLEYDVELKNTLSALGMDIAFDPRRASFDRLSTTPMKIDQVKHKTFIEVNEKGTEAAAVTSVGIVTTSVRVDTPFKMTVDRPFFCAIRDNRTGTLLFLGTIVEPK